MSYKPYTVLAPKAAVADPEPLRKKAAELAKDCGLSQSEHWFAWRGDDGVFGFANNANPAIAFICYCAKSGIPFRPQWEKEEEAIGAWPTRSSDGSIKFPR